MSFVKSNMDIIIAWILATVSVTFSFIGEIFILIGQYAHVISGVAGLLAIYYTVLKIRAFNKRANSVKEKIQE